jgi:hypothetical protein
MASVLFVCLHNAGRSQMSQALLSARPPGDTLPDPLAPRPPSTSTPRSFRRCKSSASTYRADGLRSSRVSSPSKRIPS